MNTCLYLIPNACTYAIEVQLANTKIIIIKVSLTERLRVFIISELWLSLVLLFIYLYYQ